MNKSELIKAIAEQTEISRADTAAMLTAFEVAVKDALLRGEKVTLPGFAVFKTMETAERTGRNPATGEAVTIPARRKVKFVPSQNLKELVK